MIFGTFIQVLENLGWHIHVEKHLSNETIQEISRQIAKG